MTKLFVGSRSTLLRHVVAALLGAVLVCGRSRSAAADVLTGAEIYAGACASCHGLDGRGAADSGVRVPLPDFSDCRIVTAENDGNWLYLIEHGGPGLGLSPQMPSFSGVLSRDEMVAVLNYIRAFCTDPIWPHGNLNFRRALITTKAFPEDEFLIKPEFEKGRNGAKDWGVEFSFERRVGARGQLELSAPLRAHDQAGGATTAGFGDATIAYKHVLLATREPGVIVAAALDVILPTGDQDRHLGDGTVTLGPSLLAATRIGPLVLQGQLRGDAPIDEGRADRAIRYRLAASVPLSEEKRAWVPSLELEVEQNVTASTEHVFLTPQIYRGLSLRGHIAVGVGAQIPVGGKSDPFDVRALAFFLWEYSDGGLWW